MFKIEIHDKPFENSVINNIKEKAIRILDLTESEINYFVFTDTISKKAYSAFDENIKILYKDGRIIDIAEASDMLNTSVLSKTVKKYFLCYPKEITQ